MDAKYFTYVHAIDAVIKGMAERGHGVIVNVIGTGGKVANPIHLPGGAANAALMLVTTGLAKAWGRKGVRVNAVNPGSTLTDRVKGALEAEAKLAGATEAEVQAASEARIPLGRYGKPAEIADIVLFLASDRAAYVNGAIVAADGGASGVL
jgi:NAD(P)-dependent dehydrogenase (short-subunit alcohol dehydrogenase family)